MGMAVREPKSTRLVLLVTLLEVHSRSWLLQPSWSCALTTWPVRMRSCLTKTNQLSSQLIHSWHKCKQCHQIDYDLTTLDGARKGVHCNLLKNKVYQILQK